MKVGILTFHYSYNYGGILQCFALLKYLRSQGIDAWVINRQPDKTRFNLRNFLTNKVGGYRFDRFRKYHIFPITEPIFSSKDLTKLIETQNFEGIIVGSDQIWRLDYTNVGLNYFLDCIPDHLYKMSYAASFGKNFCTEKAETKARIADLLRSFDIISVREDDGVKICQTEFDQTPIHVLDPTFLIESNVYPINSRSKYKMGTYILTYILDKSDFADQAIPAICEKSKLSKIVNIIPHNKNKYLRRLLKFFMPSVEYWLTCFYNAGFVITDSFHGVCFSIIFKKQFVVLDNKQRGSARITSLLKIFNLEKRLVHNITDIQHIELAGIDYTVIEGIKKEWVFKSTNIFNNLHNV